MKQEFDERMDRRTSLCLLKDHLTPEAVKEQGLLGYLGAEFEFRTCPAYIRGVMRAAEKGQFGFVLADDAYRAKVAWWMQRVRSVTIDPEWVVPTYGTIMSLATTIRMMTAPEEGILMFVPGYSRYEQAARRLGRKTIRVPLDPEGRIDLQVTEQVLTDHPEIKLLVLCNPNNPTGTITDEEHLKLLLQLCSRYQVTVFSDEIFAEITADGVKVPIAAVTATAAARTLEPTPRVISCTSMGKVFSLTGVPHANVIISDPDLRDRFVQQRNADHFGSVDPMAAAGMMEAYSEEGARWVQKLDQYIAENIRIFAAWLKRVYPQAVFTPPEGTYVCWVDYHDKLQIDKLEQQGLFVGDPGPEYYGPETARRYSLAVPREALERSLKYAEEKVYGKM